MNDVPRCILLLQNATKSENTYKNYFYNLNRFRKHFKIKDFDRLLEIDSKKINEMLEDWLMYLRKKVSPNSIPTMYYGTELFFAMNDVTINSKKLRRMLPAKVKRSGANPWKTEDIQKMLSACRYKRDKAIVLFLSSTGSRIGSIDGLKMKHIIEMPFGCKAVWVYADDKEEYWAFLTPESSKALVDEDDGQTEGSYGRMIAVIYCNGINLNEAVLEADHAEITTFYCSKSEFSSEAWAQKYGC